MGDMGERITFNYGNKELQLIPDKLNSNCLFAWKTSDLSTILSKCFNYFTTKM